MSQRRRPGLVLASLLSIGNLLGQAGANGDSVSANRECYEYDEEIVLTFDIEEPGTDDWIGIYPDGMVNGGVEPSMWVSAL